MAKFRKKPIVIEAVQWLGFVNEELSKELGITRSKIPEKYWHDKCGECLLDMFCHGHISTLEGRHIVCPNDWIITGIKGEKYPCKPDIFKATYDPVEDK